MIREGKRILMFSGSYLPVCGGVQTVTHNLTKQLLSRGHNLRVITNRYPIDLPPRENFDGVLVDRVLLLKPSLDHLRRRRLDLFAASFFYGPTGRWRLNNLFKAFRPEVVNVHFPDNQIEAMLSLRERFNFRLVVSLHGYDVQRFTNGNGAQASQASAFTRLRKLLKSADAITAVSDDLLRKAIDLEPSICGKAQPIPNAVDTARFVKASVHQHTRTYLLAVGRLVRGKGFDLLVDAFAQCDVENRPDLLIAGSGEELDSLKEQVERLRLTDAVRFFGPATPAQVASLMKGSLAVVVPSRNESFGIVALEALAAGKPVVATRTGGLQELLNDIARDYDGEAARPGIFLVEPTIDGIAGGLREVLQRNDISGEMSSAVPERYTWKHVAERYEQVLLGQ
jgi:glycosyltransferase involved in cell wall biosynthesis